MMKPKFFFDYIFYRVSETYYKWDGKGSSTAVALVTMVQCFTIASVFGIIARMFYDRAETAPYARIIALVWVIMAGAIHIWNYFQYRGKYEVLKEYWKEEPLRNRRLKGFLVVLSIILPIVPLILVGVYW